METLKLLLTAGAVFTLRDLKKRFPRNLTVMRNRQLFSWMHTMVTGVRPLQDMCRLLIRQCLCEVAQGRAILKPTSSLPLPNKLKGYLVYDEHMFMEEVSDDLVDTCS